MAHNICEMENNKTNVDAPSLNWQHLSLILYHQC